MFNLSPRVIARRRIGRGGDSDRTSRRRSSGRTDHEVPLDTEVRTETSEPLVRHDAAVQVLSLPNQQRNRRRQNMNDQINGSIVITAQSKAQSETQPEVRIEPSEPLMQHDAAVQDSPLPGQRRNPRRRVCEVINMNKNHPHLAQVSSLPNQRRNRRRRNMNDPINGSTFITAQSTAQLETQPEVNNAERDQLRDDSSDPKPYHVQDPQLEIQTNVDQEDSLQREGPTQINTQVLDHDNNFNAENTGAIISPHREGSVERNTQFDQFRHIGQPNFESEIWTNAQPIHVEDAPLEPEIQINAKNIAREDSQQRKEPIETNAQLAKLISGDR
ncbi:hypothetical protein FH972_000123 [Carpinus fangiana]|uniref:Uncharacterized protein n=1 Tax=Carpinus fangiana TaxID=176857 RepID=A0A5N6Q9M2_9ROSI|nr:hypothetical protein FH972_000123 [Carpinus fangiana]